MLLRTQKSFVFSSQRPSRNSCCLKSGVVWDSSDEQQAGLPLWQQARLTAPIESVESWQLFSVGLPVLMALPSAQHCTATELCRVYGILALPFQACTTSLRCTQSCLCPTASVTLCLCVALYAWADVPKEACQS